MTTQNSQNQSKDSRLAIASINFHPIGTHVDYRKDVSGDSCTIKIEDINIDIHSNGYSLLMVDIPKVALIYFDIDNGRMKLFPVGAESLTAPPPPVDSSGGRTVEGTVTAVFEDKELKVVINRSNNNNNIGVEITIYDVDIYHDALAEASVEFQICK